MIRSSFKHLLIFSIMILMALFTGSCASSGKVKEKMIVSQVDLNRYAGKWYEIARFPHRFEKDLVGVTATYKLLENGRIEVINRGHKHTLDGPEKTAVGKAKLADPVQTGWLKVSFFWIFYADYLILELDTTDYQYALIGSTTDDYLWVLSRTPQMNQQTYEMLVDKAAQRGYDTSRLLLVPQPAE